MSTEPRDEIAFTITTPRAQRLRLDELRLRKARAAGGLPKPLKKLVAEALEAYLDREERRLNA